MQHNRIHKSNPIKITRQKSNWANFDKAKHKYHHSISLKIPWKLKQQQTSPIRVTFFRIQIHILANKLQSKSKSNPQSIKNKNIKFQYKPHRPMTEHAPSMALTPPQAVTNPKTQTITKKQSKPQTLTLSSTKIPLN